MLQRPDFQNAGPQPLKVSSFLRVGVPKHDEPFKHPICGVSSSWVCVHLHVCIWKRGLALETNTPDTPTFTAVMGRPGSISI